MEKEVVVPSVVEESEISRVILSEEEVSQFDKMSIHEIDTYGSSIQESIERVSNDIIKKATMRDLGDSGVVDKLDELQSIATKQRRLLPSVKTPFKVFKKFLSSYEHVERKLEDINDAIEGQKAELSDYLTYMYEQDSSLSEASEKLRECEGKLAAYYDVLSTDKVEDGVRLQAVANRLKLITGTRVIAEQAQLEGLMIIKTNQESKYQLEQVTKNVMPILRMQVVNAIGIQANKRSVELTEKTRKLTGELVEKNASDLKSVAESLQKGRTSSVIDEEKLIKAQTILSDALKSIARASESEAASNLEVAAMLRDSATENANLISQMHDTI